MIKLSQVIACLVIFISGIVSIMIAFYMVSTIRHDPQLPPPNNAVVAWLDKV